MTGPQFDRWVAFVATQRDQPVWLGIDPGATGAIAVLSFDGRHGAVVDMPTVAVRVKTRNGSSSRLDTSRVLALFDVFGASQIAQLTVEHAVAMITGNVRTIRQAAHTAFQVGRWFFPWELFAAQRRIRYQDVTPSDWKKRMEVSSDKELSLLTVNRRWPGLLTTAKAQHNRAEALLLADYGRLTCIGHNWDDTKEKRTSRGRRRG